METSFHLTIIGGGPAGIFAAIQAAKNPLVKVLVIEATSQLLTKVKVSGGGRCNLTHACGNIRDFIKNYPRGQKELITPFSLFGPKETMDWFTSRGVLLKTEEDGRMFPVSDDSQTIIDVLIDEAKKAGVELRTSSSVTQITRETEGFLLSLSSKETITSDRILIATGGAKEGFFLAEKLGHTIAPPVPSLFSFDIKDFSFGPLSGISLDFVKVSLPELGLERKGALLITHTGFSGPAILTLSAMAARPLFEGSYKTTCCIDWLPLMNEETLRVWMQNKQRTAPRKSLWKDPPGYLPLRLWNRLVKDDGVCWGNLPRIEREKLIQRIKRSEFFLASRAIHKREFVTCGGVKLSEVNCKTMESKICPGLFFAGEVLDIDGLTGGFNFQAAWTTGMIAGTNMVKEVI